LCRFIALTFAYSTERERGNSPVAVIRKNRNGSDNKLLQNIRSTDERPSSALDFSTRTKYIVCIHFQLSARQIERCKTNSFGRNKSRSKTTWKKTDVNAILYPYRSKEKSPSAAIRTPAAVQITERVT
jgi:SPX domain protein involved in polyphosphate accumulation